MIATNQEVEAELLDQGARDRFCSEIERNFSVIAPAGVGKTRAIVQRIIQLFEGHPKILEEQLSKLVVVTYTQKAAEEMKERTRLELFRQKFKPHIVGLLEKVFFGTIHSFCLKLLSEGGPMHGLRQEFRLAENEEALWFSFLRNKDVFTNGIEPQVVEGLRRYGQIDTLLNLARTLKPSTSPTINPLPCPVLDFEKISSFTPDKRNQQKIAAGQEYLRSWQHEAERCEMGIGVPEYAYGGKAFKEAWDALSEPLWRWLEAASLAVANQIAEEYLAYRIEQGEITYEDMITLAGRLMRNPASRAGLRHLEYSIILDEAQDTDPEQFFVLLSLANSPEDDDWMHPVAGRFSMVGDPQQSIYSSRADLPEYLRIHKALTEGRWADPLTFSVTMRCDQAIVAAANAIFPQILEGSSFKNQVDYVPLVARPWAGEGAIGRIDLEEEEEEADALAAWIANKGLEGLGVLDWKEVALLCPRKQWLIELSQALESKGIRSQVHSKGSTLGENPAYAWLTALMVIGSDPYNHFELLGVLREIFGVSDHAIAVFIKKKGGPEALNIAQSPIAQGEEDADCLEVLRLLGDLHAIYIKSQKLPLRDKVASWVESIQLEERLKALADFDTESLLKILEDCLVQAGGAEFRGISIAEWAKELKGKFFSQAENETPQDGCIQLYTCHKAKGLEWPVVIVPYLFRKVSYPTRLYPRVYNSNTESSIAVALANHSSHAAREAATKTEQERELERLIYVTATRARRTLLWVNDESYWEDSRGSLADKMGLLAQGANRAHWQAWGQKKFHAPPQVPAEEKKQLNPVQPKCLSLIDLSSLENAVAQSQSYFKRKTPSRLVAHTTHEDRLCDAPLGGVDYGNWWHTMMQDMPWHEGPTSWANHMAQILNICPVPERGRPEIDLFLSSKVAQELSSGLYSIGTEVPFMFTNNNLSYDGYMDLLAYDSRAQRSLIIDWKTEALGESSLEKYRQQITAYIQALTSLRVGDVCGWVYSTQTGSCLEA